MRTHPLFSLQALVAEVWGWNLPIESGSSRRRPFTASHIFPMVLSNAKRDGRHCIDDAMPATIFPSVSLSSFGPKLQLENWQNTRAGWRMRNPDNEAIGTRCSHSLGTESWASSSCATRWWSWTVPGPGEPGFGYFQFAVNTLWPTRTKMTCNDSMMTMMMMMRMMRMRRMRM